MTITLTDLRRARDMHEEQMNAKLYRLGSYCLSAQRYEYWGLVQEITTEVYADNLEYLAVKRELNNMINERER